MIITAKTHIENIRVVEVLLLSNSALPMVGDVDEGSTEIILHDDVNDRYDQFYLGVVNARLIVG